MHQSQRDFGQTDTGMSWNRQSSEVRCSRKVSDLGGPNVSAYGGIHRQESMKLTGQGWLEK